MSNDRSASLNDALSRLAEPGFKRATLEGTMERAANLAVGAIHGADMAGIALIEDGYISTGAASIELVDEIDSYQYATDQGPCLEAVRTNKVVQLDSATFDTRWPRFSKKAAAKGVESVLSSPLAKNETLIGSLNLYAYRTMSFDGEDRDAIVRFAGATADVIAEQGGRAA
jgi:putative methionine-R-sulfoxide reductase with GAF domain